MTVAGRGSAYVIRGNALALPLPDASVDLVVTSPPYFGLRSYQDTCKACIDVRSVGADPRDAFPDWGEHTRKFHHYDGQIGAEATPTEFVDALIAATREMVRVLKPSGSIWVNLGDKYNSAASGQNGAAGTLHTTNERMAGRGDTVDHIRPKSLMGIPWRYALRCIDTSPGVPVPVVRDMLAAVRAGTLSEAGCDALLAEYEAGGAGAGLGLILRAEVIWNKPNGLPESVTDRVRRSHEVWFHFTKQPRYYSAVDLIREEHAPQSLARTGRKYLAGDRFSVGQPNTLNPEQFCNPLGKLPGSVWTIPTQPLTVPNWLGVDHYAAFPMEWPRRIIRGWSPSGICTVCGEGRRPTSVGQSYATQGPNIAMKHNSDRGDGGGSSGRLATIRTITGYACACLAPLVDVEVSEFDYGLGEMITHVVQRPDPAWVNPAPTVPAVVLDPFGGTGTTALVAMALGRVGITLDMSADYCRLAEWRTSDPGQIAAALEVEKPEQVAPEQGTLFGL